MDAEMMNEAGAEMPAAEPVTSARDICVPLAALAMPGEDEKLENPEAGDPVSFQVEGKVTRVEGEMAYVTPTAVNGEPVEDKPAEPADPEAAAMAELKGMAENQNLI